jgi:hypothetical protein
MICSTGYTRKIVGGDTIAKRILGRVEVFKNNLIALLDRTCVTIAILFPLNVRYKRQVGRP